MTDQRIYELVTIFKNAMIAAQNEGLFDDDEIFCSFPRACCGPTCDLLATFLKDNDVETIYVWGDYGSQSHAWLVVNDDRVKVPKRRIIDVGDEYAQLISQYGGNSHLSRCGQLAVEKTLQNNICFSSGTMLR